MKIMEIAALAVVVLVVLASIFVNAGNNAVFSQSKQQLSEQVSSVYNEVQTVKLKVVNGYYEPHEIRVKQGTKLRIEFDQPSFIGCMTSFNIYDLGVKVYVPKQPYYEFVASKPGVYRTGCNMGMGAGVIIVDPVEGDAIEYNEPTQKTTNVGTIGGCGCCGGA